VQVIYEDNHLIIVNKAVGEIVQGDKTGDRTLADEVKQYIKEQYMKPGNVFLGVAHRLDRPVTGLVVFARTSKCLSRLNEMFRTGQVHKTYWAIVPKVPVLSTPAVASATTPLSPSDTSEGWTRLHHWLTRNEQQNRARAHQREVPGAKEAILDYRPLSATDRYQLLEIRLLTGRHHQIRCQLAAVGMPIRGDLKYGAPRSLPGGGIALHARHVEFVHPVSRRPISVSAPVPSDDALWQALSSVHSS